MISSAIAVEKAQTLLVTVEPAREEEVIETESVTGTLVPKEEILVFPEVEGLQITEILVDEGDQVQRGQVLARLSRDILETQLLKNAAIIAKAESAIEQSKNRIIQVEATLKEAQQALERARKLKSSGNTTDVLLEKAIAMEQTATGQLAAERDGLLIAKAEKKRQKHNTKSCFSDLTKQI